ncbi:S-adenosyl-L-methionine-dependent methyltransferase [Fimicolochytrium jonesii]|uniref:S-adenosyl-L-methionine-dependent methyltransferase n=1 Tax=Fimicolochytrium jonesii TaxID=1396493 RepID=UPI0022FE9CCC|nr:S-adenosyl-L-methionine-dependent methyltransferase [Fimicolochytrium jonesii]KAI8819576.1 S-adenosyl-L-methionine-dependent methyltransferase [Fimicolochytrium jonesii]
MSRPEHTAPPEIFYNEDEASKYTNNSRIIAIQSEMTYRALELLAIPDDQVAFLLDIGCGSGLSGEVLDEEGHFWVGMDISESMLEVANGREVDGDLFLQDIGQGMSYRPGTFDGAISISVLQWLCNADKTVNNPRSRLKTFFSSLYSSLARGARAVFQFYPENPAQIEMIISSAMKAGFTGGLVVDFPNSTKAKKYYLCLFAGFKDNASEAPKLPKGLDEESGAQVAYASKRTREKRRGKDSRKELKDKNWVLHKKELNRVRGKETPNDSKYTARKRRVRF